MTSLVGGGRFRLRLLPGPPPMVAKAGDDHAALAREAVALRAVAGHISAPRLIAHRPGLLVSTLLAGHTRAAEQITPAQWRALGATLRALHRIPADAPPTVPGPDGWRPVDSPAAYAAARGHAVAGDDPRLPRPSPSPRMARIHGDLMLSNIVWDGDVSQLVDWEFSRVGDPAEDLAYLVSVNRLDRDASHALADGYGGMPAEVRTWQPLVRREADAWWQRAARGPSATPLSPRSPSVVR